MTARERISRAVPGAALALAAIAVAILILGGGSRHVVYAQFSDAGQLVSGDVVSVAGHQVGSVGGIRLASDGLAEVELDISDGSVWPLHAGTRAEIRQLSLTGIANRFVGLELSDSGAAIADGGTIGPQNTKGIVDLDILLDALTPRVRASLQQILKTGAYSFSGTTAGQLNRASHVLSPALSQTTALGRQVVGDRFALERLIAGTADVSSALAARAPDLHGAVAQTASWLSEVASQRTALQDSLVRSPAVLGQSRAVLAHVSTALRALDPALADLRPNAQPLAALLRAVRPAAAGLVPTIAGVNGIVSGSERSLRAFVPAGRAALPGLRSLVTGLTGLTPILSGIRPYIPDQIAGFFEGVAGNAGGSYDANGHYGRIAPILTATGPATSLTGVLNVIGALTTKISILNGFLTGLTRACPGAGAPPAPDGSNPFAHPDTLPAAGTPCSPGSDQR